MSALAYSPAQHAVVSAASHRTFKVWVLEQTEDDEEGPGAKTVAQRDRIARKVERARQLARKAGLDPAKAAEAAEQQELEKIRAKQQQVRWTCRSQAFWRDMPIGAAAFSGDGAVLAVSYGPSVTLWAPMTSTLLAVLSHPPAMVPSMLELPKSADDQAVAAGSATQFIQLWNKSRVAAAQRYVHTCFLPDSCLLVAATATDIQVWDVRSCEMLWTISSRKALSGHMASGRTPPLMLVTSVAPEKLKDEFTG